MTAFTLMVFLTVTTPCDAGSSWTCNLFDNRHFTEEFASFDECIKQGKEYAASAKEIENVKLTWKCVPK